MPNLPTASRGGAADSITSDQPTKEAPGFIGTLSWLMITVPLLLILIGILYGLKRWGEESDAEAAEAAGGAAGAYRTARGGARGWSGLRRDERAQEQDGTELSGLLEEDEEEEAEGREGEDAFGDGDSETTAVDGNIRTRDEDPGSSASGRWKLKREGFSTTAKDISLKSSSSRAQRGRNSTRLGSSGRNGGFADGQATRVPPSGDKRD